MIKINLLPSEYAQAQAKKEQQVILGSVAGVLIVILVIFLGVKKAQAASLDRKIRDAEAQLQTFKALVAQMDSIEKKKSQLIAKRDVIKGLNRSRLTYPVFFEDFLPILPSDVWVKTLDLKQAGNTIAIAIQTEALSNFALASLVTNFEQSKHFGEIALGPISYKGGTVDRPPILSFSINTTYRHVGPMPLEDYF